jgi:VNT family MFS transporter (synaptic vesicle glycoprotein 2)
MNLLRTSNLDIFKFRIKKIKTEFFETKRMVDSIELEQDENKELKGNDSTYEKCLSTIGFGKFHVFLLIICGFANASDAIEILCVSFILTSAECDLNMSTSDKGYLSSMTFVGKILFSHF